ncbi:FAD-linked oxidase [Phytomonospora endophytica]|nr:FAD-linked oxidase [Phytomonospora endophytica]
MIGVSRRNFLRAGAVGVATVAAATVDAGLTGPAVASEGPGLVEAGPDDPRYEHLRTRGNLRHQGNPDYIVVASTTAQVVKAVQRAVREKRRVVARSGGHCFEDFVDHPGVRVVVDLSTMTGVRFDADRRAFEVRAGTTLGETYRRLHLGWGVTLPGGSCPTVAVGGHVPGGGYGPLSRMHGLISDHLYAVEVVIADRDGRARAVIATREPGDPNRDLWWAHTGGGGGSFGIVTRYWFRTPGAKGTDPSALLPCPPATVLSFTVTWPWENLSRQGFERLVANFGGWCERNSAPGTPSTRLYAELILFRRQFGRHMMIGQVPGEDDALFSRFLTELADGVGATPEPTTVRLPWLNSAQLMPGGDDGRSQRLKCASAYARESLTPRQVAAIHHHLTRDDLDHAGGMLSLNTHGGAVNTVEPSATATAHRDSVMKLFWLSSWTDSAFDERGTRWLRDFYHDFHATTGGVPVDEGAFINYADNGLADPAWNTSGVEYGRIYFGANLDRLRRAKARHDPADVFRHTLSIRA